LSQHRKRMDKQAKLLGYTHRKKGKRNDPYLKAVTDDYKSEKGQTFITQEQAFHFYEFQDVIEL